MATRLQTIVDGKRECYRCAEWKPLDAFWDGYKWCMPCHRAYARIRYRAQVARKPVLPGPATGRISPLARRWRVT